MAVVLRTRMPPPCHPPSIPCGRCAPRPLTLCEGGGFAGFAAALTRRASPASEGEVFASLARVPAFAVRRGGWSWVYL